MINSRLDDELEARRVLESLAARQAVHCAALNDALREAEVDGAHDERAALRETHHATSTLLQAVERHEERRARSADVWLAAAEEVFLPSTPRIFCPRLRTPSRLTPQSTHTRARAQHARTHPRIHRWLPRCWATP